MALIQCPECGHNVSTMANACPNCGCPIVKEQKNICVIYGVPYDLTEVLSAFQDLHAAPEHRRGQAYHALEALRKQTLGVNAAEQQDDFASTIAIIRRIEKTAKVPPEYPFPDTPRCPTCGSTKIRKLSAGARGVSLGLFGLASKTARSQFVCNNCGYKW